MLNLTKHYEFFQPEKSPPVHILGCGALGSHIAVQLARLGVTNIHLWDFDKVEAANIANQAFLDRHIGWLKTEALKALMVEINPLLRNKVTLHEEYTNQKLEGIVFIGVDNIDVRRTIVESNQYNMKCKGFIDARMRLTDAQMYAAYTKSPQSIKHLLRTMAFTQEEAEAATPVSACGTTLSVIPTVQIVSAYAVANYITFVEDGKPRYKTLLFDAFHGLTDIYQYE